MRSRIRLDLHQFISLSQMRPLWWMMPFGRIALSLCQWMRDLDCECCECVRRTIVPISQLNSDDLSRTLTFFSKLRDNNTSRQLPVRQFTLQLSPQANWTSYTPPFRSEDSLPCLVMNCTENLFLQPKMPLAKKLKTNKDAALPQLRITQNSNCGYMRDCQAATA